MDRWLLWRLPRSYTTNKRTHLTFILLRLMQVYLMRHTTPNIEKGICYGQTDMEVEENLFAEELKLIKTKLPNHIEQFFTSPLKRCKNLAENLNTNFIENSNLMEMNFGDWENKKWDEILSDEFNKWMENFVEVKTPNGENFIELNNRTNLFFDEIIQKEYESVAIVTHAGNIRSIICTVLGLPLANAFKIDLGYGAVVSLKMGKELNMCKLLSIN